MVDGNAGPGFKKGRRRSVYEKEMEDEKDGSENTRSVLLKEQRV